MCTVVIRNMRENEYENNCINQHINQPQLENFYLFIRIFTLFNVGLQNS